MATMPTHARLQPQGSVSLSDFRNSMARARATFTQVRNATKQSADDATPKPDFITFVSLVSEAYQAHHDDLIPVQQYKPSLETFQGKGHTSLVTHAAVMRSAPSTFARGVVSSFSEGVVIKRPRDIKLGKSSSGLTSFITELRIRLHPTLRAHPHIARLRGIGWDFQDEDATIPRPILLEEFAPLGALDNFWKNWNFVRMTFKSKLEFCRDLAEGLRALHACGVVHGDVKPANILVFPCPGTRGSFVVKLTDFGHSAIESDRQGILPAFTPQWCAPEATREDDSQAMSFTEMKCTDVYSYGLVILSIMIGRSFYLDYEQVEDIQRDKQVGTLLPRSIQQVEKEDKDCMDSDLEVGTVSALLRKTIQLDPQLRSLSSCVSIIDRYELETQATTRRAKVSVADEKVLPVGRLDIATKVNVGYQTMVRCSYQLKAHIVKELETIALNPNDVRRPAAEWELAICHFSGFGVPRSFDKSSYWLSLAHDDGVVAAHEYQAPLRDAMGICATGTKGSHPEEPGTVDLQATLTPSGHPWDSIPELPEVDQYLAKGQDENSAVPEASGKGGDEILTPASTQTTLSPAITGAIAHGSIDELCELFKNDPTTLNRQDENGNTPLLLAAKHKRYGVLCHLTHQKDVDFAAVNKHGQTVLHHLTGFEKEELDEVLPQLIGKGADFSREALPSRDDSDRLLFSLGIRCCPLLNAVLHNDTTLLQSLLEAAHADPAIGNSCRICEGGSGFRRILAVSLSLFQADTLDILISHLEATKKDDGDDHRTINLDRIEVWAGAKLLPLHEIPFNSVAVAAVDLPECFFRAMTLGNRSKESLQRIIQFFLKATHEPPENRAYSMLLTSVEAGNLEGAEILLDDARERGLPALWWLGGPRPGVWESEQHLSHNHPLCTSISLGHREIFDRFLRDDHSFLRHDIRIECSRHNCGRFQEPFFEKSLRLLSGLPRRFPDGHTHPLHIARLAVSVAITARHQDSYFLHRIMECVNKSLIMDENAGIELLGWAIMNSSFKDAAILAAACPDLWTTSGDWIGFDIPYSFHLGDFGYFGLGRQMVRDGSVVQLVLGAGSYEQCQFVLKHLLQVRTTSTTSPLGLSSLPSRLGGGFSRSYQFPQRGKGKTWQEAGPSENGIPSWHECPLTKGEYLALLGGNILRSRANRRALWDVIMVQANCGHLQRRQDLKDAIAFGNVEAVREMVDRGWAIKRHRLSFGLAGWSPLQYVDSQRKLAEEQDFFRTRTTDGLVEAMEDGSPPHVRGTDLELGTHSELYRQYANYHANIIRNFYLGRLGEIRQLLVDHGAQGPAFLALPARLSIPSATLRAWAWICTVLLYTVCLPLALLYCKTDTWTSMTHGQKLGFSYLWSALAASMGGFPMMLRADPNGAVYSIIFYGSCAIVFLANHIALPFCIVRLNWAPLYTCKPATLVNDQLVQSCTNYSFLVPLVAMVLEAVGLGLMLYFTKILGVSYG